MNNKQFVRADNIVQLWPTGVPQVHDMEHGRFYEIQKDVKLPSITTILGHEKEKLPSLVAWRERLGAEVADWKLKAAGDKGTRLHSLVESYLTNSLHSYTDVLPTTKVNFIHLKKYLDKIDKIRYIEEPLYSMKYGVAGRVDIIAEYDGVESIIDIKTSEKSKKEEWITDYFLQTTGYSLMLEEMTGRKIEQLVILMAVHTGPPQAFVVRRQPYIDPLVVRIEEYNRR